MTTLADQLKSAKEAYHNLMTGRSARVIVDSDGSRVEYTAANADRLAAYIARLEADIRRGGATSTRGPLIPFF